MVRSLALTCGLFLLSFAVSAMPSKPWTRLYNGKDLSGWHVEGSGAALTSWKAEGPVLSCISGSGYLARDEEYDDFELRLEYRLPPEGNSGIGLRFPRGGWPSTDGMEIQLLDDTAARYRDLKPESINGSIYTFVGPTARPAKPPGQWNKIEVRCKGPEVSVRISGKQVCSANVDEISSPGKGTTPLNKRPRRGLIGLQCHDDPVDFRNIEIRRL
jgi:hypothetical protein